MPDPDILTTEQARARFGTSPADLARWRRDRKVTTIRTSRGHPRWLAAELRELTRPERREDRTCDGST